MPGLTGFSKLLRFFSMQMMSFWFIATKWDRIFLSKFNTASKKVPVQLSPPCRLEMHRNIHFFCLSYISKTPFAVLGQPCIPVYHTVTWQHPQVTWLISTWSHDATEPIRLHGHDQLTTSCMLTVVSISLNFAGVFKIYILPKSILIISSKKFNSLCNVLWEQMRKINSDIL